MSYFDWHLREVQTMKIRETLRWCRAVMNEATILAIHAIWDVPQELVMDRLYVGQGLQEMDAILEYFQCPQPETYWVVRAEPWRRETARDTWNYNR